MIFGGLEIVAGGYFAHKYYKNRNEKRRLEEEAQTQRNSTFPSNRPSSYPLQPHFPPQEQHHRHHCPPHVAPPQYACHDSTAPRTQCQAQPQPQLRMKPSHAQSFNIPRRPVPQQRKPEVVVQPSLQRADSMATLSRMPVANGYRPLDLSETNPPPQRQVSGLLPVAQSPYSNAAFSVSSPAFVTTSTSPPVSYVMVPDVVAGGRNVVNGHRNRYENGIQRCSTYAPTEASTQLGERDPPPPYVP